jgi:mannose-6-phosphate isomerase-like protein (cupin superfamily)
MNEINDKRNKQMNAMDNPSTTGSFPCVDRKRDCGVLNVLGASIQYVTPPHLHRATDETFLIESGEIEINRGGELLRGRRGDVIYLPKGIPHALRVIGNDEGVTLVVCVVPGGFDRFFAACAEEFKKGEPEMPLLVN